jgi:hypothetical protein
MTRLLAGLSLFMEKFDLDLSTSHELDILEKPSIVELVKNLGKVKIFLNNPGANPTNLCFS